MYLCSFRILFFKSKATYKWEGHTSLKILF